ncbi:MAG: MBOAT family protein [Clostridium sp.]|nr:MBOAT family protein [Clostridium sp.]
MSFDSITFILFMTIVFIIYWFINNKYRWILLLIASYYFYLSWDVKGIFLIISTTILSYSSAILMEKINEKEKRKLVLFFTLLIALGILFFFKYFNFFNNVLGEILKIFSIKFHPMTLKLFLPIGISFYTFQTIAYLVDVYRGNVKAEKHLGKYAVFISFFPQIVSGPIGRASSLLPQINAEHIFNYEKATYGLKQIAWGFFKKFAIANTLSIYVDKIFNDLYNYKGFSLVVVSLFFTLQIYCDFSGYSDIAIGLAKLLDIDLMTNFKSPYFSSSIKEFWSRWHISLSTWLRDYIYIPLGGNRCSKFRNSINLMITFLVSGLWHGANWTFIFWGGLHGLAQIIEKLFTKGKKHLEEKKNIKWVIKVILVILFCNIAWVFFRANSMSDAIYIFSNMFKGIKNPVSYIMNGQLDLQLDKIQFLLLIISILLMGIFDFISLKTDVISLISNMSLISRWLIYLLLVTIIIVLIPVSANSGFIYAQF